MFFSLFVFSTLFSTLGNTKDPVGLPVGAKVENFVAIDQNETPFELFKQLEKGTVVVIFIRGHWCPVCNKHLKTLQDGFASLTEKGATVVVVSPQKTFFVKKSAEKSGAQFQILFDENYSITKAFDVLFKPGATDRALYNTVLDAQLKTSQSDDSEQLPVPATFIIGKDRKIAWRHFDPDYKKRASVAEILQHLPK